MFETQIDEEKNQKIQLTVEETFSFDYVAKYNFTG